MDDDGLNCARGVLVALVISAGIWLAIGLAHAAKTPPLVPAAPTISPPWPLCVALRDGQWRRWAIAQQRDDGHWVIECAYGPVFPLGAI